MARTALGHAREGSARRAGSRTTTAGSWPLPTAGLQAAARYLPFQTMFAFPIEVAMGRQIGNQILANYLLQIIWIAVGLVVWRLVWRAGLKRYSAVGA